MNEYDLQHPFRLMVQCHVEVRIVEVRDGIRREWTEERLSNEKEVEAPQYLSAEAMRTQTVVAIKRTVSEMSTELQKIASDT